MEDSKYIVFKRADFYEMMGKLALPPWTDDDGEDIGEDIDCARLATEIEAEVTCRKLHDAVVIRTQDVFAPPALDAYANSITVALQVMNGSSRAELQAIADYFHQRAAEGWETERKIPD